MWVSVCALIFVCVFANNSIVISIGVSARFSMEFIGRFTRAGYLLEGLRDYFVTHTAQTLLQTDCMHRNLRITRSRCLHPY